MAENYFGITDTGRQRDNNEDTFIAEKVLNNQFVIACVIDGVGGYEGGEVAARIARDSILHYFSIPSGDVLTMMKESLTIANEKIYNEKMQGNGNKSMACVVTMALADTANNTFYYAHVGDTRLYLLRDQSLVKISKDHSFVGFLEDSGRLSEMEAMNHPKRNEINKALGFDLQIRKTDDYIETGQSPFLPGDMLMLCSDGLSDMITSQEMTSVLTTKGSLPEKGKVLIEAANKAGGKDNITVVMVQNNTKPLKIKATKPIAVKKKPLTENSTKVNPTDTSPKTSVSSAPGGRGNKGLIIFLSLLSTILLALLLYFLLSGTKSKNLSAGSAREANLHEKVFQDSLGPLASNLFSVSNNTFPNPIVLTDTLRVDKDSIHIIGSGQIVLQRDSSFTGPAIYFSQSCKYAVLENIRFEGFDLAVLSAIKSLYFKNVQFVNCRIPLQHQHQFPDNAFITGSIDSFRIKADSLVLKTPTN
ncbi:MAG TPA: protein phosphatase 2C domain-containing protein [Chitinophagaceae bacterium]|nr:protein phosphatase 2C domain-containing protein [Chitinophagaceae bacterium]